MTRDDRNTEPAPAGLWDKIVENLETAPDASDQSAGRRPWRRRAGVGQASPSSWIAAASLAIAGGAHLGALPAHRAEGFAVAGFFLGVAVLQIGAAVLLRKRMSSTWRIAITVGTVGVTMVWALSRTFGLPIGGHSGAREAVGLVDAIAVAAQLVTLAALGWRPSSASRRAPMRVLPLMALVLLATAAGAWLTPSHAQAHEHNAGDSPAHDHPPVTAPSTVADLVDPTAGRSVPVPPSTPAEPTGHSHAPGHAHSHP